MYINQILLKNANKKLSSIGNCKYVLYLCNFNVLQKKSKTTIVVLTPFLQIVFVFVLSQKINKRHWWQELNLN